MANGLTYSPQNVVNEKILLDIAGLSDQNVFSDKTEKSTFKMHPKIKIVSDNVTLQMKKLYFYI